MRSSHLLGRLLPVSVFVITVLGCTSSLPNAEDANEFGHTAPSSVTEQSNQQVLKTLPFEDRDDFEDAQRGLIAQDPQLTVAHASGEVLWDMPAYSFIDGDGKDAPASANPSLWRQAALNNIHGLFEVKPGLYQIRGYDLANMTIIEAESGWILVDPLTSRETASKAFLFARKHLGEKPVHAILFTHSHMDHFGGVQGIIQHLSEDEKAALEIIAPAGFEEEATSENIIAGPAMVRRAGYMYGKRLPRNIRGQLGNGLGKSPAFGTFGFKAPTELISQTGQSLTIDGVTLEFQIVSGSEAPAEFTFYLPQFNAFCGAELVSRNLHNLYTLRGAKVRDALLWSDFIDQARRQFSEADVYFGSHHWPVWGQVEVQQFLAIQRDTYKFIHDQSVRLINSGLTPNEIAESLTLPPALSETFHNQGYYGTVAHNAKAVYQYYMGWYTANPAQLHPLPEPEAAQRYIDMMGGADTVLEKALDQFDAASQMKTPDGIKTYRWLAELLNHLVFADPDNEAARALLARVYDQLGYQAESAPWRNVYLTGAYELRHGRPEQVLNPAEMEDVLLNTPVTRFFDSMAVRVNAEEAEGETSTLMIQFTDLDEHYLLTLENSVLRHEPVPADTAAQSTLTLTRAMFVDLMIGKVGFKELLFSDDLSLSGSRLDLIGFFGMLDKPDGRFNIVTP